MSQLLKLGQTFAQNLVDDQNVLILPTGRPVTQDLLDELNSRGCFEVFFVDTPNASERLAPYDSQVLKKLSQSFEDAPSVLDQVSKLLQNGERTDLDELNDSIDECFSLVRSEPSAVLSTVLNESTTQVGTSARSLRLASLAMVAADLMNCSESECRSVGRAAMLHDISLTEDDQLRTWVLSGRASDDELASYRAHPNRSIDLLRGGVSGLSDMEMLLISQVHEQCDGSGFPRGLKKHHLHPLGRLLNLADAFLTLIDPRQPSGGFVPADALAYLIQHTLYGSFDRACIQAVVQAAAAYPIGTKVLLSDRTTATVVRSNGKDYLRPIVRRDNGSEQFVDLRTHGSQILGLSDENSARRLPISRLDEVLWS